MLPSTSSPVKRACDSCHRRKVKCVGEGLKPCKNCISAGLTCTYNAIPQKKGPKGSRAKVLSELRETQRQSQLSTGFSAEQSRAGSPVYGRTPGLLTVALSELTMEFYYTNLYSCQPILLRQRFQDAVKSIDTSVEAYSMVAALCAFTMIHSNMPLPQSKNLHGDYSHLSNAQYGQVLLDESVRIRKAYDYIEKPSSMSIVTSYLYHACYFCLDKQNSSWYYLREATTQAHSLGMHTEETYKTLDIVESATRRRLYWLLLVSERAYAIHRHRSISLYPTINLPTFEEDPTERAHLSGFLHLINLFKPFDDTFFNIWNKIRTDCLPAWLLQVQEQVAESLPGYLDCSEIQAVELRVTQQWLKTMVWQLAISHGFVSSMVPDKTLSLNYPIEIARDLVALTNQISHHSIEMHGMFMIEKIFDVSCTLIDVLSCLPYPTPVYDISLGNMGPREYLSHFVSLVSVLRGGQTSYLPMLIARVNDVLPNSIGLPPTSAPFSASTTALAPNASPAHSLNHHNTVETADSPTTFYETQSASGSVSAPGSHNATPYESPTPRDARPQLGHSPITMPAEALAGSKEILPAYLDQHAHLSLGSVGQVNGLPVSMTMGMALPVGMPTISDGLLPHQHSQHPVSATSSSHHGLPNNSLQTPPQTYSASPSQHLQESSPQHFQSQQRTPSPGGHSQQQHLQSQHSLPHPPPIQQTQAQAQAQARAQFQLLQQQRQLQHSPFAGLGMGFIDDDGSSFYR